MPEVLIACLAEEVKAECGDCHVISLDCGVLNPDSIDCHVIRPAIRKM
jgi:hypothetical protein